MRIFGAAFLIQVLYTYSFFFADLHTSFLLPRGLLQHEPILVHRPILRDIFPSSRPHENSLCVNSRLDPLRFGPNREEHPRDAPRHSGHDSLQLGSRVGQAVEGRAFTYQKR